MTPPSIPIPILLYHSVAPDWTPSYEPWCVHPDRFDEHLEVIVGLGHTPLTISELVDAIADDQLPDRPIAVTFDDGRADFAEHALPGLLARDVPATLYVVTGQMGRSSSWLPMSDERDAPMMEWDDVRAAAAVGIEIGSHSRSHVELDVVPTARLRAEVADSRRDLAAQLGRPVRSIAYPHGYHSDAVVRAVKEAGYDSACAVKDTWSRTDDDRFALARMFVWGTTTARELESTLRAPISEPERDRRVLRAGWRGARWARQRIAAGART